MEPIAEKVGETKALLTRLEEKGRKDLKKKERASGRNRRKWKGMVLGG